MKTIYLYLLRQVGLVALAAVTILTFILVMLNAFQRLFDLLVNYDVPAETVLTMLLLLVPQVITWTLPWGLLMGVLIVFGRFSHDNELLALNVAGIGLLPIVAPIILLSLGVSLFCLYNNAFLAPNCMTEFKMMVVDLGKDNPTAFLKAGTPITKFKDYVIYIGQKNENVVKDVFIWELSDSGIPKRSIRAQEGILTADMTEKNLTITLMNARIEERGKDPTLVRSVKPGLKAGQLPLNVSLADSLDITRIEDNLSVNTLTKLADRLSSGVRRDTNLTPIFTEIQKKIAFSFAPLTFVFVGIPLAIQFRRKETSIGFILSLAIGLTYYLIVTLALALKERATAYPDLIVWMPNIIFQFLGFILLYRANYKKY